MTHNIFDGTFGSQPHPCEMSGCDKMVPYDDEPYCFDHSPDEGSHVMGYSYIKAHPSSGEVLTRLEERVDQLEKKLDSMLNEDHS